MLTIYVALFLLYLKLLFWFFCWGITPLEKRCWLMMSVSKSSNPCVKQVTQKPFLLTSVKIEKRLRQSTLFRGLICENSKLSLDPKIWHGSYFCLEILVCKFWQDWKMDHLPVLWSLILILIFSYQSFVLWEKASSLYLKWFLAYQKSCTEGDQLRGGLAKYARVDIRFQFTT